MELTVEHLKEFKRYLDVWKRYKKEVKLKDFTENIDKQNMVLHAMFVAIQSAIDLANDMIVSRNLEEPETYRETFEILGKNKIIPSNLSSRLASLAGFRNVIAHVYFRLDAKRAYKVFQHGYITLGEFEKFIERIVKKSKEK
ncbi:MAG: DUF86 domain-containing protein [Candidatus Aenigmarchaeota archaeon]|nr:DUF86 domain-containing protein [Candidatus Aenigmarchaeota archaeon]